MPFGKIHSKNPVIVKTASKIGRTPASLAMKMLNFSSLDPEIINSGRKGLGNASKNDRNIWDEFHNDWENQTVETQLTINELSIKQKEKSLTGFELLDYSGITKESVINVRIKQDFFRKAVLASYDGKCCITGLDDPRLLVASHIIPWSKDNGNRLNPSNGLCLSALHDKAFDQGLITVTPDYKIKVAKPIISKKNHPFLREAFILYDGKNISLPEKFLPDPEFLRYHNKKVFLS